MERTIKVTGKGKLSVKPDLIRLVMNLGDVYETYESTLEQSTIQVELLKDGFEQLGFERSALKTLSFDIDTKYESYQDDSHAWKQRFIGYEFKHSLKIEFDAQQEMLGKVLWMLGHASMSPEFRIVYTVKDMEASKNQLLANAVADSKMKAMVLAEAAGVELGEILNIDYSWGEIEFTASLMNRMSGRMVDACSCDEGDACYDIDIEPDDMNVSDIVTVIWSIG